MLWPGFEGFGNECPFSALPADQLEKSDVFFDWPFIPELNMIFTWRRSDLGSCSIFIEFLSASWTFGRLTKWKGLCRFRSTHWWRWVGWVMEKGTWCAAWRICPHHRSIPTVCFSRCKGRSICMWDCPCGSRLRWFPTRFGSRINDNVTKSSVFLFR